MPNFAKVQLEQTWQRTLQLISENAHFNDVIFNAWYKEDSHLFDVEDDFMTIVVPYKANKRIMVDSVGLIQQRPFGVLDMKVSYQILLKSEVGMLQPSSVIKRRNEILFEDKVEKEYTFDSLVVGKNNWEVHVAALSVCYYPGKFNNPLSIFGNSGLKRAYLLRAIGNYVKTNKTDEKVLYIYSGDLVTLLIEAMKNKMVEGTKEMTCSMDHLLIDDIQCLEQSTSQEIFLNVYNKLISDDEQIAIVSDIHPTELRGTENRLISYSSSGLSVSIGSSEFETVKATLQKRTEGHSDEVMINNEVPDYPATRFTSDARKLEETLNELLFKAVLYNPERIDITFAKEIFKENPIVVEQKDELTPKKIKNAVRGYYGLARAQVESKSRTKNIVNARHIAMYLCRAHLEMPLIKIGFGFGNRDHSIIMSSYEKMMKLLREKEIFQQAVMQTESSLGVKQLRYPYV